MATATGRHRHQHHHAQQQQQQQPAQSPSSYKPYHAYSNNLTTLQRLTAAAGPDATATAAITTASLASPMSSFPLGPTPLVSGPHPSLIETRTLSSNSTATAGAGAALTPLASATATWEALRKQAQQLEGEIDTRLVSFGKLGLSFSGRSAMAGSGGVSGSERVSETTALQIEDLLRKLSDLVESMSRTLDEMGPSASSSMMHTLQRHRDILFDYTKEFKKTKVNINAAREHAELLQSVQDDISVYKANNRTETLLNERESIDRSHKMADQILETAFGAQENLHRQRGTVLNSSGRLVQVMSKLPVVGGLIQKIAARKKRDNIVLACVIAACLIFLLLWIFF